MADRKLSVVIAQAPGKNPNKRQLEEDIAAQLLIENTANVSLVPHLNDLSADDSGALWLKSVPGDVVVLAWLYPRAAHWILDRMGVKGREGTVLLRSGDDDEDEPEPEAPSPNAIGALQVPNRSIYVLDLRIDAKPEVFLSEIRRIARESTVETVSLDFFGLSASPAVHHAAPVSTEPTRSDFTGNAKRRWYPVIDYSRCTNCMECIDFCLFGVYGLDDQERILVEQQDNCKKGCPACSRVCPANAIIFPEHKTPGIAGAPVSGASDFKIDLSKLFGAPSALELAVLERDTELVADGRTAVGMSVGIPKRQSNLPEKPRDALDDLIDGLDSF
ncbi:Ferredoxin-2 [Caulifigura coniformis]|uniref:Ferredoxin-2 n=1 Tax=Caulifigura coniformis TaxID=2527983 RepID=A0A517SJ08_9PLAN|nr:ferredoxin family protein [Caulifigura coniformis]QDT56076.1 Ferredoxin-2 [Caulifigura coniformis]